VNNLVLRFLFAAALLMQSCLVCGLARAQSQTDFRAANSDSSVAVSPAPPLAIQFPATDESLTAETPPDDRSRFSSAVIDPGNLFAYSPTDAAPPESTISWAATPAADPPPNPKPYSYNENPNQWQLGITFALVRFRSSVYFASAPGFNTSLAYWFKDGIAIEGSITTAFAPPVFANEHFRYLSYAAGPKFSFGHGRLQPWAHALAGGVHLIPQTASGGQNGLEITLGGGVDYPISGVISAKAGVDYLGTHMFGEWQSSVQILAGFSFRF
jgi:hypothetical protein